MAKYLLKSTIYEQRKPRGDAAFPLSDHASYDELLQYVELVAPKRVYTTHGFTEEFAADLRRRGVDALALGELINSNSIFDE